MRILSFTTLFPNSEQPSHGIFVENRLAHVAAHSEVQIVVVAPVPYFPVGHPVFGRFGESARVPATEQRRGLRVFHPRFVSLPGIGNDISPFLLNRSVRRAVRRILQREGPFDLLDAHYFYPDGVAAASLAREFSLPFTVTARGSDLTWFGEQLRPRQQIIRAACQAGHVIAVCDALAQRLVAMGISERKISVLRNGVDLELFSTAGRQAARRSMPGAPQMSVDSNAIRLASVGHLIPRKGHDLVIRALKLLPDARLWVVGSGPEEAALRRLAGKIGVAPRVYFAGRMPPDSLPDIYRGVDVLVLASSREGWANVLLEAMACGTPVAASAVDGTPEVVRAPEAGQLMEERTPAGVAAAVRKIVERGPDPRRTRAYAESHGWDETTQGQLEVFGKVLKATATFRP